MLWSQTTSSKGIKKVYVSLTRPIYQHQHISANQCKRNQASRCGDFVIRVVPLRIYQQPDNHQCGLCCPAKRVLHQQHSQQNGPGCNWCQGPQPKRSTTVPQQQEGMCCLMPAVQPWARLYGVYGLAQQEQVWQEAATGHCCSHLIYLAVNYNITYRCG